MTQATETREQRDDRLLSAYLDGELPPAEADEITERLAREPELAERLAALRGADDATRALFEKLDDVPMPQGVLDLLQPDTPNLDTHNRRTASENVVPFPQRFLQSFLQVPVAVAAALALAAGFLGSRLLLETPTAGIDALYAQQIPAGSDVHDLLEHGVSTTPATFADGSEARLLLTFEDQAGDWCRQLAVSQGDNRVQALACRRDGQWQTESLAYAQPASGEFMTAGSDTPPAMNAAIDRLIGSEPLGADAEAELVRSGWK